MKLRNLTKTAYRDLEYYDYPYYYTPSEQQKVFIILFFYKFSFFKKNEQEHEKKIQKSRLLSKTIKKSVLFYAPA